MDEKTKKNEVMFDHRFFPDARAVFTFSLISLDEIKDNCLIVLDTNVLLLPYDVSPKSIDEIRHLLSELISKSRLIIPGQVAREFAKNKSNKIKDLHHKLSNKRSYEQIRIEKYPILSQTETYNEVLEIEKGINSLIKEYREKINCLMEDIVGWGWNDPVAKIYKELFRDIVFDIEIKEEEILKDFENRSKFKIPPGYKDKSKYSGGIGDLVIWYTILKIGQEYKNNVVFVTGEEKSDWFYRSDNKTLFPRYELIDEFRRCSGEHSFHIIGFSKLLELYGAPSVVVQEVRQKELFPDQRIASFTVGKSFYVVDGKIFIMDVAPYIREDRTYLPLFYACTAMEIGYEWVEEEQSVIVNNGDHIGKVSIGNNEMLLAEKGLEMDVPPEISNGHIMMPIRWVAQLLGCDADWNAHYFIATLYR